MIYQNLKVALALYLEHKTKALATELDVFRLLKTHMGQVDLESDWSRFTATYPEVFLLEDLSPVHGDDLTYDGHDDPLTKVVEQGAFYKKESGMFKSVWKPYRVILTGSGFFHMINSSPGADKDLPELSLDLSECTVGPLMLNDKEPEEFTITEKAKGLFSGETKHRVGVFM